MNKHATNRTAFWSLVILALLFLAYAVLMTVAWIPRGFAYNLDDSFMVGLNKAFAENIQFGKDFVYTYGPYGFVQNAVYVPETYGVLMLCRAFIGLVVGVGLLKIAVHCWQNNSRAALWLLPFLCFFPNSGFSTDSFYILVVTLPLLVYFYVDSGKLTPSLGLLIVGTAFSSLIKQTSLTLGFAFVLLMGADQILRRRRFPTVLVLYLFSVIAFWLLAGQSLSHVGAYLANGSQIVKGFPEAMGRPGPLIEIIVYVISALFFVALSAVATWRYKATFDLLPILGLLLICFLTFKASFVRHDSHALQAAMTTIPAACLYSALLWPEMSRLSCRFKAGKTKVPLLLVAWTLLLINAQVIFNSYPNIFNIGSPKRPYPYYYTTAIRKVGTTLQEALSVLSRRADLQAIYEASVEQIRADNPLPPIDSAAVDLYPNNTAVLFAYGLPYRPRPTTQSFTAYTGALAQLNAAHLRDGNAPETILFDPSVDDDRLPGSDDGLSWPELLTLYDIADVTGEYLVLERSERPRQYAFAPVQETAIEMGEWISLPDEKQLTAVWMKLNTRPNILGELASALFKLPPLYMEVDLADGSLERYRVLADVANTGQLLSPLLGDRGNFAYMASPLWRNTLKYSAVKRFRLVAPGWTSLTYPRSFNLQLSNLTFDRQTFAAVKGWSSLQSLALLKSGQVTSEDNRKLMLRVGPAGKPVLLAHADTRVEVDLPLDQLRPTGNRLLLGFGILEKAWRQAIAEGHAADGVEFRVLAISPNEAEAPLFARLIAPLTNEADKAEQVAEIDLPDGISKIALETREGPNQNDSWDWSYWSKLTVRSADKATDKPIDS